MEEVTEKENNGLESLNPAQRLRRSKSISPDDLLRDSQQVFQVSSVRTPLQDLNCRQQVSTGGLNRMVKMAQYGQLTPLSAPMAKKEARRWSNKATKTGVDEFWKESHRAPAVQYKKFMGAITSYQKDLIEREDYIKTLEEQITTLQANTVLHNNSMVNPRQIVVKDSIPLSATPTIITENRHSCLTLGGQHETTHHVLFRNIPEVITRSTESSPCDPDKPQTPVDNELCVNIGCSPMKVSVEHNECHSSGSEAPSPDCAANTGLDHGEDGQQPANQVKDDQKTSPHVKLPVLSEEIVEKANAGDEIKSGDVSSSGCNNVIADKSSEAGDEVCKLDKENIEQISTSSMQVNGFTSDNKNEILESSIDRRLTTDNVECTEVLRAEATLKCVETNTSLSAREVWDSSMDETLPMCVSNIAEVCESSPFRHNDSAPIQSIGSGSMANETDSIQSKEESASMWNTESACVVKFEAGSIVNNDSFSCGNNKSNTEAASSLPNSIVDRSTNTEISVVHDTSTNTDSTNTRNSCMNTSIPESRSIFTNTDVITSQDDGTSTDPLHGTCVSTNTDAVVRCDSSVNTSSVSCTVSVCQTEAIDCTDTEVSAFTGGDTSFNEVFGKKCEIKEVVTVGVATSPSRLFVGRPSEVGLSELSCDELRLQLETACISNTVLRQELTQKQQHLDKAQQDLKSAKDCSYTMEGRRTEIEVKAKAQLQGQITTLKAQQTKHLSIVADLEERLQEKANTLEKLESKHKKSLEFLKEENATLQADLKRIYQQKKQELEALRSEYAQQDYKRLYFTSQERVTALESQLNIFTGLVAAMHQAQETQVEAQNILERGFQWVREVAARNREDRAELQGKLSEWEEEKSAAKEEIRVEKVQHEAMKRTVEGLKQTLDDRDRQIQQMTEAKAEYREELQALEENVQIQISLNEQLSADNKKQLEELEHVRDELGAASLLQQISGDLSRELASLKAEVKQFEEEKQNYATLKERYEAETQDLKTTLAQKSQEIDKNASVLESFEKLKVEQKNQSNHTEGLTRELADVQEQLQSLQASSRETKLLTELEMGTLREALEESKGQCDMLDRMVFRVEEEKGEMEERLTELREKNCQLQAELDHTKTQAHMMLLDQGSEISTAVESLNKLSTSLNRMYSELQQRSRMLGIQDEDLGELRHKENMSTNVTDSEKIQGHMTQLGHVMPTGTGSLLSSVMHAIHGTTGNGSIEENLVQCSTDSLNDSQSATRGSSMVPSIDVQGIVGNACNTSLMHREASGQSSNDLIVDCEIESDDQNITDTSQVESEHIDDGEWNSKLKCHKGCGDTGKGRGEIFGGDLDKQATTSGDKIVGSDTGRILRDGSESGEGDENVSLWEQIDGLFIVVGNIIHVVKQLDAVLMGNQELLKEKVEILEESLLQERSDCERQLKNQAEKCRCVEVQLHESKQREREAKSELAKCRSELSEREWELKNNRKLLEEKSTALEAVVTQEQAMQKSQEEVARLHRQLTEKLSENQLLQESLEDALTSLDKVNRAEQLDTQSFATPGGSDRKYARENHFLKAEVQKLRQQVIYSREQGESLATKANHRQKTLQYNVQKAEQELMSLDSTVEKLRQLLRRHKDEVRLWPEAKHVWNEVIYDKRLDEPSMLWK